MKNFALIGRRLSHSFSQRWFEALFARLGLEGYSYRLAAMPSLDGLRRWASDNDIRGFNITVPYKLEVIPHLDRLDDEAAAVGAVNCVTLEQGRLVGHNTDSRAFRETFLAALPPSVDPGKTSALVLGTGGAARAVAHAFGVMGMGFRLVSRTPERHADAVGYAEAASLLTSRTATVLVNATPVGMFPDVESSPWPQPDVLASADFVYDLVYNPSPTLLMRQASAAAVPSVDGLAMLHRQAELSWLHFQQAD